MRRSSNRHRDGTPGDGALMGLRNCSAKRELQCRQHTAGQHSSAQGDASLLPAHPLRNPMVALNQEGYSPSCASL